VEVEVETETELETEVAVGTPAFARSEVPRSAVAT
jgi:hypothetical protein